MRESLTVLAALLILCLSVALAAPYFIDWNAQRGVIETQLSHALGEKVSIRGNLDLKLLPTPYLHLQKIEILDEAAAAHLTADDVFLEIAIPPLLRGEVDFIEARVQRPHLKLTQSQDGSLQAPQPAGFSGQARFERIIIEDGQIQIDDLARSRALTLDHMDISAEANSLDGPFKGDGNGMIAEEKTAFRFSTSAREGDNLRLKLIVDKSKTHPRADFDGTLTLAQRKNAHIAASFKGNAGFSGLWHGTSGASMPWRLSGPLRITSDKATMDTLEIRFGDEDRAANATGTAELDFYGSPKASLSLHARQIDIDRLLADPADAQISQTLQHIFSALTGSNAVAGSIPFNVDATADTATLNGETLADLSGAVISNKDQPVGLRFESSLPGRSHLHLDGRFESGSAKQFNGRIDANIGELDRLTAWLGGVAPDAGDALRKLPFHAIDISGETDVSQVGFSGRDLKLKLDGSTLLGSVSYTRSVGSEPARLFVDATSPSLDLANWPGLQDVSQLTSGTDLSIRFDARTVKLAGLGRGALDTGEIRVKLTKAGQTFKLENLNLNGFGSTAISASGAWTGQTGSLDAKLNVPRLADMTAPLQHLIPNAWLDILSDRAGSLSPLQLDVHADATTARGLSSPAFTSLSLKGTAGTTSLKADIKADPRTPNTSLLTATLDAPDSATLLHQLGAHILQLNGLGRGHVEIKTQGPFGSAAETTMLANLAGLTINFRGRINALDKADSAGFGANGQLHVVSADVSPLLQATGLAFPDFGRRLPLDLASDVDWRATRFDLRGVKGSFASSMLSGSLTYAPQNAAQTLTGTLDLDKSSAASLLELALGAPQPAKGGFLWSNLSFNAGLPDPPSTSLTLHIKAFDILPGLSGENAAMQLEIAPEIFTFRDVTMKANGGTAAGTVTLRRDGPAATLSGRLNFENYALNLPSLQGRVSAAFDMSGNGSNALALVSSLAGSGHASISDLAIGHADPDALSRVFADVEHDKLSVDETEIERAFARELDRGNLKVGTQPFDLAIAAGTLRLTPTGKQETASAPVAIDDTALSLDLRNAAINQKVGLTLVALPKDWQGPPPRLVVNFKGAPGNPARSIEAVGFVNTLAGRAIARETARIQAYEFDAHERAVFNQRLQTERRHDAEVKAEEDARRAAEFAAKLERLRKAAEEARKDEMRKKLEEPLQLIPQQQAPSSKPSNASQSPPVIPNDPSTLGRY